ncbi:MAG: hypothetical protein IJ542_01725 [Clostridia bacterium]|nr:hypothetical protein [Clostridia bacterium]
MKNKFVMFVLLSILCLPLCLGLAACNKNSDPDKLELDDHVLTLTYGEPVNINALNVTLVHPNGETELLSLKTNENPNGFTFETINSTADPTLDLLTPSVGRYNLKISYRSLSSTATVIVNPADYPTTVTLSCKNSVQFLNEKPNITLDGLSNKASIDYHFQKEIIEDGEPVWADHSTLTKQQFEDCDTETFFTSYGFEVGKYRVYASLSIANYKEYTTNSSEFVVTKTSLAGRYYVDVNNITYEFNPQNTTLAGYSLASKITLAKDNRYTGPDLEIYGTFNWKEPTTSVAITDEDGEVQTVVFSSKNYTLTDVSDELEINVIFKKAGFPYWNVALAESGERLDDFSFVDLKDYYDFSLLVSNSIDSTYIDLPSEYTYVLLDSNNNVIANNRYTPTQTEIETGNFVIKFQIEETENYEGKTGSQTYFINPVVQLNDVNYTTFGSALRSAIAQDSIDNVETIKLLTDIIEPTKEYEIKVDNSLANIVFDLNGHILRIKNLSLSSENDLDSDRLVLTIRDGYFGTYNRIDANTVELVSSSAEPYAISYSSWKGLSITIQNAHVASHLVPLCGTARKSGGSITLSSSEFVSTTTDPDATGTAAFLASNDSFSATACTFSGYSSVYIKSGTILFSNCSFNATGLKKAPEYSANSFVSTGAAIVVDNSEGYSQSSTINIAGGKATLADQTCPSVQEILTQGEGTASDHIVVTMLAFNTINGSTNELLKNGEPQLVPASNNTSYNEIEEEPDENL